MRPPPRPFPARRSPARPPSRMRRDAVAALGRNGTRRCSTARRARTSTSCCTWRRCGATGATSWSARPTAIPPSSSASPTSSSPCASTRMPTPRSPTATRTGAGPPPSCSTRTATRSSSAAATSRPSCSRKLLAAVIEDPSALPSYTAGAAVDPNAVALSAERRARTEALLLKSYDKSQRRLRRHPSLHPWRHARMGAGARPRPAAQRRARGLARDVGPHAGRRAPPDRSGVGRHVPVFRQARLVGPALSRSF